MLRRNDGCALYSLPDNTELGHTQLVQHQVDTGDTTSIKQPVRHVPFVFRDKIAADLSLPTI